MKLTPPFPTSSIVQKFGDNAVSLYSGMGLKGHPGDDFGQEWGTQIPCAADGVVASVLSKDNSDPSFFKAVNTIVEQDGNCYEVQYGHCSEIAVNVGDTLTTGAIVGKVGNTGSVYQGGVLVSESDKLAGSHAGSHLHFQVRRILKVSQDDSTYAHYLNDGLGRLVLNGSSYAVPEWDNGYNGCVSPDQFFGNPLQDEIKSEIQIAQTSSDSSVKQAFYTLIANNIKKLLGWG